MVGGALELESADEVSGEARRQPALHQGEQARRIADDITEQPVDPTDIARVEREGAHLPKLHPRQGGDLGHQRRLVNADDAGAQRLQRPGPAAGAATEIEAALARTGMTAEQRESLP